MENKRRRVYMPSRQPAEEAAPKQTDAEEIKVRVEPAADQKPEPQETPQEVPEPAPEPEQETETPSQKPETAAEPETTPAKRTLTVTLPSVPRIKFPKKIAYLTVAAVLCVGAGVGLWTILKPKPPVPASITSQISFTVFFPANDSVVKVDRKTIKYDRTNHLLSYIGLTTGGEKVIFSEQATPPSFSDIQSAYTSLVERLQGYSSFDTPNGRVSLTHPKELKGVQTAIMNSKGTLMFARTDRNVADDEWRRIFNNLTVLPD